MHAHVRNRVQQHPLFRLALTGPLLLWSPSWISWLPAVSSCGLWSASRCRPCLPPSSFTGLGRGISTPAASPMLPISVASMLQTSSHTSSRSDGSRAFRRDPLGLVRAGGGSSSGSSSAQRVTCTRPSMRPPSSPQDGRCRLQRQVADTPKPSKDVAKMHFFYGCGRCVSDLGDRAARRRRNPDLQ